MKTLRFLAIVLLVTSLASAQSVRETVEAFAKIGSATSPSFSPDSRQFAFVSALSGTPQIWIMPTTGGFPEQITAFDDPVTGVRWSPDGKWLAFGLAPGGGLNSQVWLVRPNGTGLRRITDGGRTNNWLGEWLDDASALTIASNRRDPAAVEPYLVDPDGNHTLIAKSDGIASIADVSRDARTILLDRLVTRGNSNLHLVDRETGRETLLTPHEGPAEFSGVLSPDGKTVWLATNATTDRAALGRVVIGENGPGPIEVLIARDDAELEGIEIDPSGSKLLLGWNVAGRSELQSYEVATGRTRKMNAPGEIVFSPRFSQDGRYLLVNAGGAAAPIDIWLVDTQTGDQRQLTRSPHPGIDLASLVRPELVQWKAHDGLPLSGWLYRPDGAKGPGPIVLSFHGGPEGQSQPVFLGRNNYFLNEMGVAILFPNVRGSTGFGKTFVKLDNGTRREESVQDIGALLDWIATQPGLDPSRVMVTGGSYGGYMTLAVATNYADRICCALDVVGVSHFGTFLRNTESYRRDLRRAEYGDERIPEMAAFFERISPLNNAARINKPLFVVQGGNDPRVPRTEAEQIVARVQQNGTPVWYLMARDEGHGFARKANQDFQFYATVTFIRQNLLREQTAGR